ncbi:MAG: hypothetical protein PHH82_02475 [Candidatus ainarchaeum sp.]|nr:hypothetical protein [Candidatus ainarchaeum sp.]
MTKYLLTLLILSIIVLSLSGCITDNITDQKKACPFECCYDDSQYLDKGCQEGFKCSEYWQCKKDINTEQTITNIQTKTTPDTNTTTTGTKPTTPIILDCPYQCCENFEGYKNKYCDNQHYCSSGNCFLKDGCEYNNPSCNLPYICINNSCKLEENKCVYDDDCDNWEYCNNKSCELTYGACNQDSDCLSGLICDNHYCNEQAHEEINYGNALQEVYGIMELKEDPFNCLTPEYVKKWNYTDLNIEVDEITSSSEGVGITIFVPDPTTERLEIANQGKIILEKYIPQIQSYIVQFPCKDIIVQSFGNAALGSPGSIVIGGESGVNHPWLLGHELVHSYFFNGMCQEWLTEAPSSVLPLILITDFKNDFDSIGIGHTAYSTVLDDYKDGLYNNLKTIDFNKPVCDLTGDYIKSSYAGRYLILEYLYFNIGKENTINTLKLVLEKYKYTSKKISNSDFCKAALYFTPQEQKEKVKSHLNYMLCGACEN